MASVEPPSFTIADTEHVLKILGAAERAAIVEGSYAPRVVLIGGQAVNYWAERYRSDEPELQAGPYTSKDVDFQAASTAVDWVGKVLGKAPIKPEQDHATESTGLIVFTMANGATCRLDFLRRSIPNTESEVLQLAVPAPFDDGSKFWVMHPYLCLRSRAYNVLELRGKYDTAHAHSQLRASVHCLRHFIIEMAEAGHAKEAREIAKKVYRYSQKDSIGQRAFRELGIDPFLAVPVNCVLGERFAAETYTRWLLTLQAQRSRFKRPDHTKSSL